MIYNFKDFVTKVDENVNSNEFLNKFGLTEEEDAAEADAPVEEEPTEEAPEEGVDLEAFKKEHLDVMFNELSSDDFDSFYSSEFKEWKEMEDGEEKEAKKEEILRKSITQEIYTPLNEYELTFKTSEKKQLFCLANSIHSIFLLSAG